MSSSTSKIKLLLDENVHFSLLRSLKENKFDVFVPPKGTLDKEIARLTLKEKRVLITNDADFSEYSEASIYSVVWLRVPQSEPDLLVESFLEMIDEVSHFKGKLIVLYKSKYEIFPLQI